MIYMCPLSTHNPAGRASHISASHLSTPAGVRKRCSMRPWEAGTEGSSRFQIPLKDMRGHFPELSGPCLGAALRTHAAIPARRKSTTLAKRRNLKFGRKPKMHARPHIRQKLIELKLRRWCRIALDPKYYPGCTGAQA